MDLMQAVSVSASGMAAQSTRMQVISENIANAESVVGENGNPYRRKVMHFESALNKQTGMTEVKVSEIAQDNTTPLRHVYNPNHALADENGFVAMPNVDVFLEQVDMRDATRAYQANMAAIEAAKEMMVRSIDTLR